MRKNPEKHTIDVGFNDANERIGEEGKSYLIELRIKLVKTNVIFKSLSTKKKKKFGK